MPLLPSKVSRFQAVSGQFNLLLFEVKANPLVWLLAPRAPTVEPSVVGHLVTFVMAVARCCNVDNTVLVEIASTISLHV